MRIWILTAAAVVVGVVVPVAGARALNLMDDNDEIVIQNGCFLPIRMAVHYVDKRTGKWTTKSWFEVPPKKQRTLYRDGRPVLSGSDRLFFFGDTDYGLEFRGADGSYSEFIGGRHRVFYETRFVRSGFGVGIWGGLFTRLAGVDSYVHRLDCAEIEDAIRRSAHSRSVHCFGFADKYGHVDIRVRHQSSHLGIVPRPDDETTAYLVHECRQSVFEQAKREWMHEHREA